jgi:hypothetical protein
VSMSERVTGSREDRRRTDVGAESPTPPMSASTAEPLDHPHGMLLRSCTSPVGLVMFAR